VLAGGSDRAAQEITAEADTAGLDGNQRTGTDACVRYLGNKRKFLRYDQALEVGWPIATGVIEGACRHLIADRLSLSGARWGLDGAEAVLTLRAVISNGDFEEYGRFHLEAPAESARCRITLSTSIKAAPPRTGRAPSPAWRGRSCSQSRSGRAGALGAVQSACRVPCSHDEEPFSGRM
jgi:hypothetical protein